MICDTLIQIDPDGRKHYKPKKAYKTLDDAIANAKLLNASDNHIIKLVAYKCTYCHKFHLGRNGKVITEKEKIKLKKEKLNNISFKILGKIELPTKY